MGIHNSSIPSTERRVANQQPEKNPIEMKVFTTLSAVLALASADSDAFFPHGGIRPLAQQQMRQPTIQLRPTVQTYGVGMIQQDVPMFAASARRAGAANAAAAVAAAAAGTPVSPRFTYFEVNQQMQQPIMPMREGEMFEYDVNYVESKKDDKSSAGGGVGDSNVVGIKEGDIYRFQKGDYDVKVNIKGVEASSYRKSEDKERDVEVKINGHANSSQQDKQQEDLDGRRRVDVFNEQDSYSRGSLSDNRLDDVEQKHDVQVKIKSASGSRKQQHQDQAEIHDVNRQKNNYRARQDFDGHERRMMSYHRLDQDRMRHMTDRRLDMSDRRLADRQMSTYAGLSDRQMADLHLSERQLTDRQMGDRHMSDRQMGDRHMSDRQMTDRHMSDRQMTDRHMSDRQMTDRQMTDRHMSDRQMTDRPMSDRQMGDRHMSDRQMSDRHMAGERRLPGQMDLPNERRVYDERLRLMSDRRMADRRMADRRHLLPAYRQRFNNELNEFSNARRTINTNERNRLF